MSIISADMNPIRFYNQANEPDFTDIFPNNENIILRQKYIEGIYPVNWYKDHLIDKAVNLQFQIDGLSDLSMSVYAPSGSVINVAPTDITPLGWILNSVYKYTFTPDEEGVYYCVFNGDTDVISDKFYVASLEKFRRRLVKIDFYNSVNDYGMVFWDDITQKYSGTTYFTGQLKTGKVKNEISAFEGDRGVVSKLRSTPVKLAELILTDIHYSYVYNINQIFSCDYLVVNGIQYQTNEVPEVDEIEKSDLVNITINLSQVSNLYYVNL